MSPCKQFQTHSFPSKTGVPSADKERADPGSTEIGLDDLLETVRWPRRDLRRPLFYRTPSRRAVYDILALGAPRPPVLSAPAGPVPVLFQVHLFVSEAAPLQASVFAIHAVARREKSFLTGPPRLTRVRVRWPMRRIEPASGRRDNKWSVRIIYCREITARRFSTRAEPSLGIAPAAGAANRARCKFRCEGAPNSSRGGRAPQPPCALDAGCPRWPRINP